MSKPKKKNVPQNGASAEAVNAPDTAAETVETAEASAVEASAAEATAADTPAAEAAETPAPEETPAAASETPASPEAPATAETPDGEPAPASGETARTTAETQGGRSSSGKKRPKKPNPELEATKTKLVAAEAQYAAEHDRYLRLAAEYDNFRRRTAKEKEAIHDEATAESIKHILPVIDTLERAAAGLSPEEAESPLGKGILMTLRSAVDALTKMGVEEIPAEIFDPDWHNAVMHVEDDTLPEGAIVEVFLKGYRKGDRVIRYSMVKVAN